MHPSAARGDLRMRAARAGRLQGRLEAPVAVAAAARGLAERSAEEGN